MTVVRHGREQLGILVQRLDHRVVGTHQGAVFLLLGAAQVAHQLCGELGVGAVARHRQAPATEGGRMGARLAAAGQGSDADLVLHDAVLALHQGPDIRPVTHEQRISRLEYTPAFFLGVIEYAPRGDVSYPTFRQGQSRS
ncbi:hypothetical protein D3C76_893140 [compost metagenome]